MINFIGADGSTRAVSLVRIFLPLLIWTEWGEGLLVFRDLRPPVALLGLAVLISTSLMFIGFMSRSSAFCAALSTGAAIHFLGQMPGRDYVHHHTYMLTLSMLLLAFTSCGGSYSVDRWLVVRQALRGGRPVPNESGPLWAQRALCVHVSTVYLWSAFAKLTPAFMSGARMQHFYLYFYGGAELPPPWLSPAFVVAAWLVLFAELFLAFGLWSARTRRYAILIGIAFHLLLYYTLPVATFSVLMLLHYLLFLDPNRLHAFIERLGGPAPTTSGSASE